MKIRSRYSGGLKSWWLSEVNCDIPSTSVRYLNQNILHLRRWKWKVCCCRRLTRNRAPDCTDMQISSIESPIASSAPSLVIEMEIAANPGNHQETNFSKSHTVMLPITDPLFFHQRPSTPADDMGWSKWVSDSARWEPRLPPRQTEQPQPEEQQYRRIHLLLDGYWLMTLCAINKMLIKVFGN